MSSGVRRYRKRPVEVEAVRWEGCNYDQVLRLLRFAGDRLTYIPPSTLVIHTLEGDMTARVGDYIIRGVHGEHYPCKPDIFAETYEEVTTEADREAAAARAALEEIVGLRGHANEDLATRMRSIAAAALEESDE